MGGQVEHLGELVAVPHDFEPNRHFTVQPCHGFDGQAQIVVLGDRPAVEEHEAILALWPRLWDIAHLKMTQIRKVVDDEDFVVGHSLGAKVFSHGLINGHDAVGQPATDLLL